AMELEKTAKDAAVSNPAPQTLQAGLEVLATALAQVMTAVGTLGGTVETVVDPLAEEGTDETAAIPEDVRRAAAERMRTSAEIGDIRDIGVLAEELAAEAAVCHPLSRRLTRLVDDFDFEGVLLLADELDPDG
nr:hypothetical protein [Desulfobacterales bacterium]